MLLETRIIRSGEGTQYQLQKKVRKHGSSSLYNYLLFYILRIFSEWNRLRFILSLAEG
jgi:hypothetical protein